MAADITPIQLGLTEGNVLTLWAPRWVEDGEDWEAFLGHEEHLYVFADAAHLAAFIRASDEHDLVDHPEWETAVTALADELVPDEDHRFDIVGVPELVAEPADLWTLAELADTVAILRSLAEVCDLPAIEEVLDASDGFSMLGMGERAFMGRTGERLWDEIGAVVSEKWDQVVEALDGVVATPEVDAVELDIAQRELAAVQVVARPDDAVDEDDEDEADRDPALAFWGEMGIDPIRLTVGQRAGWTLRCYLDDEPVLLSHIGRVLVFSSPEELAGYVQDRSQNNSMVELGVYAEIQDALDEGTATVVAGPENTYELDEVADGLLTGPGGIAPKKLALAVELLDDAAAARRDEETTEALGSSSPLGALISVILRPDPDRMPPSPPFEDESAAFTVLVDRFSGTLDWDNKDDSESFPEARALTEDDL